MRWLECPAPSQPPKSMGGGGGRGDKVLMVVMEEEDFHGWVVGGSGAGSGDDGVSTYPAM